MKKIFLLSFLLMTSFIFLNAQPVINQDDLPGIGDTVTINILNNATGLDYEPGGTYHLWNFHDISATSQRVDTFMSIQSTPLIYLLYFQFLSGCNLAGTQPDISTVSFLSITNVYNFYKTSASSFSQYGYGAQFNGTSVPIKYNNPDVQLILPLTYGEKDSCDFMDTLSLDTLGGIYYSEKKHRVNFVDGWGTVITPIDTFQAMRVLSTITCHDSVHVALGGFPTDYVIKEYKWYADNMSIPVFKVSVRTGFNASTTVEYNNEPRKPFDYGVEEDPSPIVFYGLYPNPGDENTNLYFSLKKPSDISIDITDIQGKNITSFVKTKYPSGFSNVPLHLNELNLSKGIYFVRINSNENTQVVKLQID